MSNDFYHQSGGNQSSIDPTLRRIRKRTAANGDTLEIREYIGTITQVENFTPPGGWEETEYSEEDGQRVVSVTYRIAAGQTIGTDFFAHYNVSEDWDISAQGRALPLLNHPMIVAENFGAGLSYRLVSHDQRVILSKLITNRVVAGWTQNVDIDTGEVTGDTSINQHFLDAKDASDTGNNSIAACKFIYEQFALSGEDFIDVAEYRIGRSITYNEGYTGSPHSGINPAMVIRQKNAWAFNLTDFASFPPNPPAIISLTLDAVKQDNQLPNLGYGVDHANRGFMKFLKTEASLRTSRTTKNVTLNEAWVLKHDVEGALRIPA